MIIFVCLALVLTPFCVKYESCMVTFTIWTDTQRKKPHPNGYLTNMGHNYLILAYLYWGTCAQICATYKTSKCVLRRAVHRPSRLIPKTQDDVTRRTSYDNIGNLAFVQNEPKIQNHTRHFKRELFFSSYMTVMDMLFTMISFLSLNICLKIIDRNSVKTSFMSIIRAPC